MLRKSNCIHQVTHAWPLLPLIIETHQNIETGEQQSRSRLLKKAACAAVSLSGLVATTPFILGSNSASAEVPALAAEEVRTTTFVAPALAAEEKFEYFKFDVQLSEGETGSFTVEVRPGKKMFGATA